MGEIYKPLLESEKQVAKGEILDWEIPFICDECGESKQGDQRSDKSDIHRTICVDCSDWEEIFVCATNKKVSIIIEGTTA